MNAYREICAYSCFRLYPTGGATVDHLVPKSRAPELAYEWCNFRLSCSVMNSRKRDFEDVLDPFEVQDGWFRIELDGFQVCPEKGIAPEVRKAVNATIARLGLNDHRLREMRASHVEDLRCRRISFEVLVRDSPFVARELERQNAAPEKRASEEKPATADPANPAPKDSAGAS